MPPVERDHYVHPSRIVDEPSGWMILNRLDNRWQAYHLTDCRIRAVLAAPTLNQEG